MDVTGKYRPNESEVDDLGPAFRKLWDSDFKHSPHNPNKPLALMTLINTIHVTDPGLSDVLDFKTGFFSDAQRVDIKKCAWAYNKQRDIVRRMDCYRGEVAAAHPPFAAGSLAACIETEAPLGRDVAPLEYTEHDDAVLEDWLRQHVETTWHSLGTCKMAPLEEGGVVDASLGVYGVEGLNIADMSIPPLNVAANTNNTAIAIGENAADIFIRELGLGN
ncbi:hypothetical protein Hte_008483 [Hypoxylon texense]